MRSSPLLMAVDAGGTSTRAVLVDASARCLGYGTGGAGNPTSSGPRTASDSVVQAASQALAGSGVPSDRVAGVLLAMAGSRVSRDGGWVERPLRRIGFDAPVRFRSDLLATFCSGTPSLSGYGVVAGTGAAAVRVEGGDVVATSDGLGWLLGDVGSGFWVGHQVVLEALAALDGRAPATDLTRLLLQDLGVPDVGGPDLEGRPIALQEAVSRLYALRPVQLAQFAPLAFAAASAARPDPAAARIVEEAARGLAHTLDAVRVPAISGPVVLGGGTVVRHVGLAALVSPGDEASVRYVVDGTVGAAVLALRGAGVVVGEPEFDILTTTVAALR